MSISLYWNDELKKITYSNVPLNTFGEFDKIFPSIFKIKALNNYDNSSNKPWYNSGLNIINSNLSNIGIGTTNPKEKLHLIGNSLINGSIIPTVNNNFNLGSSNLRWNNLYLSSNSSFITNLNVKCSNFQLNDNFNNFLLFSLSNNQLFFNSNGNIINTINFNNYSNIIYSNILLNTSNQLINDINNKINNFNISTDTINTGTSNRFINCNIYNNNLTVTSNIYINNNYYLKNQLLPFGLDTSNSITKMKFDGNINYSNIINRPVLNNLFATNNYINIGFNNQVNFPLADVAWANEWFLYIGISPILDPNSFIFWHLTPTINSKWWFNGTIINCNAEITENSDIRIKKEITTIENPIDKLMALQPKEYYLCDDKDYLKKYGILAQDVNSNEDLKHLVYQDEEYIANIYTNANYNNKIITTEILIIDNIEINDELKILIDNNNESKEIVIEDLPYHNRYKKRYVKIKEIIDNYSFEIYEEIEIMEKEKNKIFIYGKKVKDFLKLDYSSLYSLNIEVNKQLYYLIESNNLLINNLNNRISKLEK
jgi:hypothetical protein